MAGPVLAAGDAGFADEVRGWLLNFESTPDVVVGATSPADVAVAIRFAVAEGLPVRIQGTGHGAEVPIGDGLLITTKRLDGVRIDPTTRLARIGAGVEWARVLAAAAAHGMVPISGSSGTVGAVGFLLGGGLGPLVRSHGFGSDWVRDFEVVTAAGELIHANANEHVDLFWALRGGKGGLGVVTEVTVELASLGTIYGGSLTFDAPDIEAALCGWIDYVATADPRVTTSIALMRLPELPFIPEPVRGRTLLSVRFAFPGDATTGERLAAPLRAVAPVYLDALGEMSVAAMDSIHGDPTEPSAGWTRAQALNALDRGLAASVLQHAGVGRDFPFVSLELRHLGSAAAVDVPEGSAVGGRSARGMLTLVGAPNPTLVETIIPEAADAAWASLRPWFDSETNVNFAGPLETPEAVAALWSAETLARLIEVRAQYDPNGTFAYGA